VRVTADFNHFYEPFFQFGIDKPDSWRFVPPAWSPVALLKNNPVNANEWPALANQPFVCFMGNHASETEAYPTVQVTARRSGAPSVEQAGALVQQQLGFMADHFPDFESLAVSSSSIIAGHRAISIRAQYTLIAGEDGELSFPVCARSYVVFASGFAFTVGMTSAADPRYFDENEFAGTLQSITIGRART